MKENEIFDLFMDYWSDSSYHMHLKLSMEGKIAL